MTIIFRSPAPARRSRHEIAAALRHLLACLRDAGMLVHPAVYSEIEAELQGFDEYMERVRGLAVNTRTHRVHIIRRFLSHAESIGSACVPPLSAKDLRRFLADELQRWSPASASVLVSTLRSYLRFRLSRGEEVSHLIPSIPSPAHWRLARLPDVLVPSEVARLLASFTPDLPSARRAYAMVRCVADLGLRSKEVAELSLDDIDWTEGTIRVGPTKSRRVDLLPLPQATGSAIAAYLRVERPATANRHVFVRHVAPVDKPIGPGVVRRAVREAYERCGLPHTRVHVLRHTLASRLLADGGTLKDVADILRHRSLDTSLIYAKVDIARLAVVALPWPGSAP